MRQKYPFSLAPLPYTYTALSPYLDARTLHLHHDVILAGYVERLNALLQDYPAYHDWSLLQLATDWRKLPDAICTAVRHNAGGIWNHQLYFAGMNPCGNSSPSPAVMEAIKAQFGSWADFRRSMRSAAGAFIGSGYLWLLHCPDGGLLLMTTENQTLPPQGRPLLNCDLWEHAYFLRYENRRAEYFENWFRLINWSMVDARYDSSLAASDEA